MKVERDLHMAAGDGANGYAPNSRLQRKALLETRPVLQEAVEELYASLSPGSTMVVADLGCSAGPNTLLVVSEVMKTIHAACAREETADGRRRAVAVQCFLNDLPGNDFNLVFRSLEQLQKQNDLSSEETMVTPSCYVAGLPGSFYTNLFPGQSVHLFCSSYSLMWRSKWSLPQTVPDDLSNGTQINEGNIYIGKTTPPSVIKLFQEQFKKDFQLFLMLRYKELVCGGRFVLTVLGRKSDDMLMHGEVGSMWELLAHALQSLAQEGRVEQEKINSFNLPFYAPSVNEVKALIKEDHFNIEHIKTFECNWDPYDDSDSDVVLDSATSGDNVAHKSIRAVIEPLIMEHFGESILDELFSVFASMVAKHLEIRKAKYPIILLSLKKKTQ
ncbi:hypothetical protein ACP4OV_010899 [Aristida adscensionis]